MSGTGNPTLGHSENRTPSLQPLDRASSKPSRSCILDFSGKLISHIVKLNSIFNHDGSLPLIAGCNVQARRFVTMLDNNIDAVVSWLAITNLQLLSSVPINTALRGEFSAASNLADWRILSLGDLRGPRNMDRITGPCGEQLPSTQRKILAPRSPARPPLTVLLRSSRWINTSDNKTTPISEQHRTPLTCPVPDLPLLHHWTRLRGLYG